MPDAIGIVLEPVQSSNIKARGYNEGQRVLAGEFVSGDVWHYSAVPLGTWERWCEAPSAGSFFVHHIKGKFPGVKMTGECPDCGAKGPKETRCTDCGCSNYGEANHVKTR